MVLAKIELTISMPTIKHVHTCHNSVTARLTDIVIYSAFYNINPSITFTYLQHRLKMSSFSMDAGLQGCSFCCHRL